MGLLGTENLGSFMDRIKSKVRSLKEKGGSKGKKKKPYVKIEKSSSVKFDIMRRKTRRLIDETLKAADRPGKKSVSY
ncbi:uncharacterized protein LOC109832110 [Asparagus officinalis]|uniref:uncharacterized protein LOC109832110 n=1 Tax=Asparagus officinalis TaxID=4686 RepID=UPI00098E39B4|nr:uncharacterized protein LOC109832110 [Asparagus officinalis]